MTVHTIVMGGTVVTPAGRTAADVAILGEKIVAVGCNLGERYPGSRILDARGHYVLPGAVDVHVHLDLPFGFGATSDDFRTGTRAAARGGVTTVIDFATPFARKDGRGHESLSEAVDNWHARASCRAIVDYSFHVCITDWKRQRREVPVMIRQGIPTFKEYMVYPGLMSDDAAIYGALEYMRDKGATLMVHAESPALLNELVARHHKPGLMREFGACLHAMSRPAVVEVEAVERAIRWCSATGGRLYVVHVSSGESVDLIRRAQDNGVNVHAETCPHYLELDDSLFAGPDGHLFGTCPPVRSRADSARLWSGVQAGVLSCVSTDTCTFTRKQKARWRGDWTRIPMGLPGLETLVPIVYTRGVLKRRLTLEQMCGALSEKPAKLMGLWPRKGGIQPGADADLVIMHPTKRFTVDPRRLETNCDWSPYEGWSLAGFARTTLSRGEVVVDGYTVVGRDGRGQWLPRRPLE